MKQLFQDAVTAPRAPLELVTHPVDLLHVGEDHLGVDPALLHHPAHVLGRQEVWHAGELLAGHEGQLVVLEAVLGRVALQGGVVEGVGEEVVDEGAEAEPAGPGLGEVDHVDVGVVSGPALAPDEDGLHLGAEGLLPGDAELDGQAGMGAHSAALRVAGEGQGQAGGSSRDQVSRGRLSLVLLIYIVSWIIGMWKFSKICKNLAGSLG